MSDTSTDDPGKSMEQPNDDLSKTIKQLPVNSDENSKPPKNLSDMPIDVVGMIIERSGYKQQLILRKVCKSLRELVDKQKPALTRLKVCCKRDLIICTYNGHRVAYVSPEWNRDSFRHQELFHIIITENNYEKVAFDDLAIFLKNPKLKLYEFSFNSKEKFVGYDEKMQNILKSINHQLFVEACEINIPNPSNVMSILPYLKPGILEKITILPDGHGSGYSTKTMEQIALLEQWKQAEWVELWSGSHELLIQYVSHFKYIVIHERVLRLGRLIGIRNCILEHKNPQFCSIWYRFHDFHIPDPPDSSYYTVPDSEYYLEIMQDHYHTTIMKKKK